MTFIEFQFDTDLRHKKSFIIDLELDIITQEIDSKLEMNTTSHKNVTGFIFHFHGTKVSPNRETNFSPDSL